MKLIVGLGNPGPKYSRTRHNAGFWIIEELESRAGASSSSRFGGDFSTARWPLEGGETVEAGLLRPATFMNASGESVAPAVEAFGLDPTTDLLVVYDDLDLPVGRIRLRARGGCGGHRGMESIAEQLGASAFPRLRFGIGRPREGDSVIDHVLSPFEPDEEELLNRSVLRAADAAQAFFGLGAAKAMERFNAVDEAAAAPGDEG